MKYPNIIQNLIECFKKLPGIGEKSAERMALSVLEIDKETIDLFAKSLKEAKTKIRRCEKCNNLSEEEKCEVCKDKNRNKEVLCVVEEPKFVNLFERLNIFDGYYHVLDGLISPIDGINPEDINIATLIDRVKKDKVKEIILALKPSIEGETTALYISKILEDTDVKISKIAHGVPMGADIDYVDSLTLEMALENRRYID
ncbi:MAG: recombination protein RecR [Bacilli bacterium]|nr:recombination protein RecR [Bacilli bacterium]